MESFGLFQFLQNLLNSQGERAETPPLENEETHKQTEEIFEKENVPIQQKNAAAEFLENHERRARRRK